jgi:hypothetical protein
MAEVVVRVMEMVVEAFAEAVMEVEKAEAVKAMSMVVVTAVEMVIKMAAEAMTEAAKA